MKRVIPVLLLICLLAGSGCGRIVPAAATPAPEAVPTVTPKSAAPVVEKLLTSAIANAEYKELDRSSLYVAEVYANQGPTLKRYWARSHGRADMIKKHTSHITIVLDQK